MTLYEQWMAEFKREDTLKALFRLTRVPTTVPAIFLPIPKKRS